MTYPIEMRKCWLCEHWEGDQKRGTGYCNRNKSYKRTHDTCGNWQSVHGGNI